jgi:serine/threonine protein kinase
MPPSNEEALFALALAKPASERAAWLDRECGDDKALRARLDALLAAHEKPETLLATQAESARPTIKLAFAEEPADEAVGQTLGRYKLLERVGEGGCGVVYVAEQTEPVRRRVALKVIKLGMDTRQVVARFEAERQALAMMDHPNIAKVLDAGTTGEPDRSAGWQPAVSPTGSRQGAANSEAVDDAELSQAASPAIQQTTSLRYESNIRAGRPYFVMELVRGIRITDYCDQANLTTKERLDLFIKVCQAIQHAHQKGIIHRDIKPSNNLVTLHDGVPVQKVIDFGIAKATEGRLTDITDYTQLHQFIGTPAYMSPDQAEMSG